MIAGGTGLIGTALLKEATAQGYEVHIAQPQAVPELSPGIPAKKKIDLRSAQIV
jgi:uncharacterized protein YbjT (DUF2867 family)